MVISHRLWWLPAIQSSLRHYAKKPKHAMATKMVHQEIMRYVNPFARINIQSEIDVRVQPADVHQYANGDVFIAQLLGDAVKNCSATLEVDVSDADVNVVVKKLTTTQISQFTCNLKIPIRAELHIQASENVRVEGTQGEALQVKAAGNLNTKNVRATNISLYSERGNIICDGILLGKCTALETHNGNIVLDKLQGDSLNCSTKGGDINTDCCYVESSKFQTETGCLELKNVHKCSEVHVHKSGALNMIGVHGSLTVIANGGSLNLQLSELIGKSHIVAQNLDNEAIINISDTIEQNTKIEINACKVNLDDTLAHVTHALSDDKSTFFLSNERHEHHYLVVNSTGEKGVRLGKQSWTDLMRQIITVTD